MILFYLVDYTAVSVNLIFIGGSNTGNSACTVITIIDDIAEEAQETFAITLTQPVDVLNLDPDSAVVTIISDEGGELVF